MEELFKLESVKRTFLGFQPSFDDAGVVVIPVPYDSTTSYGVGTRFGPSAIIDASTQLELYDIELGKNISDDLPVYTLDELVLDKGDPAKTMKIVEKAVSSVIKAGKKPVVLGGEHSITLGAVKAVKGFADSDISVLHIDAHADLRDSYEGTKHSHASVMRRVREITKSTVQVGIRSMCDEEAEYIKKENPTIFYGKDFDVKKIVSQLKDKVYVTFDIDGFDPSVAPGTGTPEPGGLLWEDVLEIMRALKGKQVLGFDVVEVLPTPPLKTTEFIAAKLAYKMMGYFWGQ